MKNFWLLIGVVGLLSLLSPAQTVNGSASGNASVSPGQVDASAKASQNAQTGGAAAIRPAVRVTAGLVLPQLLPAELP
jgi:hypothetical protein